MGLQMRNLPRCPGKPPGAKTQHALGWLRGVSVHTKESELDLIDENRSEHYIKGFRDAQEFLRNWSKVKDKEKED